jgi:hypothetical protein
MPVVHSESAVPGRLQGCARHSRPGRCVRPMSENAIRAAYPRMGYPKDEMSSHGFRSMASALLHEQGWNHQAIERQLAHSERNAVSAAQLRRAFAGAAQDDAGLGGLFGWTEGWYGSDTAVQKGVNKNRPFTLAPQVDHVMLDCEKDVGAFLCEAISSRMGRSLEGQPNLNRD